MALIFPKTSAVSNDGTRSNDYLHLVHLAPKPQSREVANRITAGFATWRLCARFDKAVQIISPCCTPGERPMQIFVMGGTGLIGGPLIDRLIQRCARVALLTPR